MCNPNFLGAYLGDISRPDAQRRSGNEERSDDEVLHDRLLSIRVRKYRNVLRLQNLRTATIVAFRLDDGTNLTENVFDRLQEAKFNALDEKVACREESKE